MTTKELQQLFVKRIKRRLVALHIDQRELARRTGVSEHSMSKYMNGHRKPPYDTVVRIAQALGCSVEDLIGIDEPLE